MKNTSKLKAVILAAGRGKRLKGVTEEQNKCMLHFDGKPLVEHSLDNAVKLGVDSIILVVGHLAESIINHVGNNYKGVPVQYVIQWEMKGLVSALEFAAPTIGNDDFMLFLGDEFFINPNHEDLKKKFYDENALAACGVINVTDKSQISKTYSILFDEETKKIHRLIEKPRNPLNNLMGTGNIIFKNKILEYIEQTPINQKRGEKELPDLIQCAIDDGEMVSHCILGTKYVNVNTPDEITEMKDTYGKDNSSYSGVQ